MPVEQPRPDDAIVLVLRCRRCGDTFPVRPGDDAVCPSCRSEDAGEATEPLL